MKSACRFLRFLGFRQFGINFSRSLQIRNSPGFDVLDHSLAVDNTLLLGVDKESSDTIPPSDDDPSRRVEIDDGDFSRLSGVDVDKNELWIGRFYDAHSIIPFFYVAGSRTDGYIRKATPESGAITRKS